MDRYIQIDIDMALWRAAAGNAAGRSAGGGGDSGMDEPKIAGRSLTDIHVSADGSHVRLGLVDAEDRAVALDLPLDCVNQLIMTLPHVMKRALRTRYGDSRLRLVFPLGNWSLEEPEGDRRVILTLTTDDGFEVSFAVEPGEIESMHHTASRASPAEPALN